MDDKNLEELFGLLDNENFQEALTRVEKLMKDSGDDPYLHAIKAICLLELDMDPKKAVAEAKMAYSAQKEPFMKYVLGWATAVNGDLKEGIKLLNAAVSEDPENIEYLIKLAELHEENDDLQNALKSIIRAQKVSSDDMRLMLLKSGVLNKLGRHKEAVYEINRAINLAPNFDYAHFLLAQTYAASGDSGAARKSLQDAIRLSSSEHPEYHELMAEFDLEEENFVGALTNLDRAISGSSGDEQIGYILEKSKVLDYSGRENESLDLIESIYKRDPTNPLVAFGLIDFHSSHKRNAELDKLMSDMNLSEPIREIVRFYSGQRNEVDQEGFIKLLSSARDASGDDPFQSEILEMIIETMITAASLDG